MGAKRLTRKRIKLRLALGLLGKTPPDWGPKGDFSQSNRKEVSEKHSNGI